MEGGLGGGGGKGCWHVRADSPRMRTSDPDDQLPPVGRFAGPFIDNDSAAAGDHAETWQDAVARARREGKRVRRSGAASGDRRVARDATPRRDLVAFDDEPGVAAMSNRRKRTRLNKGGMFFNSRDREAVLLIVAHGWLDRRQLAALLGGISTDTLRKSLTRLVRCGLLDESLRGLVNQKLYRATAFGLKRCGARGFTPAKPRLQTVQHTAAIAAVHAYTVTHLGPNAILMTEREVYAAAASGEMTPRILAAAPWTAQYADFGQWVPTRVNDKGRAVPKRPDGYLLTCVNGVAQPPITIEVERNVKSSRGYYIDALLTIAHAAQAGHIARAVIYFAPSSDGTLTTLSKELTAIYDPARSGFNWPTHLPKVATEVHDLDEHYKSVEQLRGWLPSRKEVAVVDDNAAFDATS